MDEHICSRGAFGQTLDILDIDKLSSIQTSIACTALGCAQMLSIPKAASTCSISDQSQESINFGTPCGCVAQ